MVKGTEIFCPFFAPRKQQNRASVDTPFHYADYLRQFYFTMDGVGLEGAYSVLFRLQIFLIISLFYIDMPRIAWYTIVTIKKGDNKMKKEELSKVMKRAWEIKKEADRTTRNGVWSRESNTRDLRPEEKAVFGECLKVAWAEFRRVSVISKQYNVNEKLATAMAKKETYVRTEYNGNVSSWSIWQKYGKCRAYFKVDVFSKYQNSKSYYYVEVA